MCSFALVWCFALGCYASFGLIWFAFYVCVALGICLLWFPVVGFVDWCCLLMGLIVY